MMLLVHQLLSEDAAKRREMIQLAADALGGKAALGRELGYVDGAYVGQMIRGERPVTEKTLRALSRLRPFAKKVEELGLFQTPGAAREPNVGYGPEIRGQVPLISWVAAGSWNGANDPFQPGDAEKWLDCPAAHSARTYALRVRGDSMTAPHGNSRSYPEGCVIFVDPLKRSPINGQRIIAKLEGSDEVTFKTFKQEDGRIWLQPINPTHDKLTEPFKVLGTVIGKWEDE